MRFSTCSRLTPPADGISDRNKVVIRSLQEDDWSRLPSLFAAAFHRVQPFASLTDKTRLKAAEDCLGQYAGRRRRPARQRGLSCRRGDNAPVGATLVTLPPRLAIACAEGLPHLTWIFVGPFQARQGIGTALLGAAARALLRLGLRAWPARFSSATNRACSGTGKPVSHSWSSPGRYGACGKRPQTGIRASRRLMTR